MYPSGLDLPCNQNLTFNGNVRRYHAMSDLLPGYHTVRGSDVQRDGMYLELIDESTGDEVAEVFYSDVTHEMSVSVFKPELPLPVVELLIEKAKHDLPPTHAA
jgi:hypothetical protein